MRQQMLTTAQFVKAGAETFAALRPAAELETSWDHRRTLDPSRHLLQVVQLILQNGSVLEAQVRNLKTLKRRFPPKEFSAQRLSVLTLCREARQAHARARRALAALQHAHRGLNPDLSTTLQLYLRMVTLQQQRLRALTREGKNLSLYVRRTRPRRPHPVPKAKPLAAFPIPIATPASFPSPAVDLFVARPAVLKPVLRWLDSRARACVSGCLHLTRTFYSWLMDPVIDTGDPAAPAS